MDKTTDEPTGKPTDEPTGKPTDEPTGKTTDEPTGKPTDKPTDEPKGKPTDEPKGKPTDKPTYRDKIMLKHAALVKEGIITGDLPPIGSPPHIMRDAYEHVVKLYYRLIPF